MIARPELRRRLLLVLFALGTNMGIKQIASGNHGHGETEAALRHVRRLYLNGDNLRRAIVRVANATFAERDRDLWGEGTAVRIGLEEVRGVGRGTDDRVAQPLPRPLGSWSTGTSSDAAVRIYSQLKACSSSEVAAMIEGLLHHCTSAEIDPNYVDTHGQSAVGFAFCHLLGFELLPRLKNIGAQRLYWAELVRRGSMTYSGVPRRTALSMW